MELFCLTSDALHARDAPVEVVVSLFGLAASRQGQEGRQQSHQQRQRRPLAPKRRSFQSEVHGERSLGRDLVPSWSAAPRITSKWKSKLA